MHIRRRVRLTSKEPMVNHAKPALEGVDYDPAFTLGLQGPCSPHRPAWHIVLIIVDYNINHMIISLYIRRAEERAVRPVHEVSGNSGARPEPTLIFKGEIAWEKESGSLDLGDSTLAAWVPTRIGCDPGMRHLDLLPRSETQQNGVAD